MAKRISFNGFSGNASDGRNFFVNLHPNKDGSLSSMALAQRLQKGDSNLTNLATMLDMTLVEFPRFRGDATAGKTWQFGIDSDGYIYFGDSDASTLFSDFIERNKIDTGGSDLAGSKVSIVQSLQGDVLYTYHTTSTSGNVGRVTQFVHDGGDSGTVLEDSTLAGGSPTLTADGSQKVWNLTDGSSATITGVDNANGRITCSGGLSGGSDNTFQSGDYCLAFLRLPAALTTQTNEPTGSDAQARSRQVFNFEDSSYVLNDNYIEAIDSSLAYTAQFLQLHDGYIAECAAVNGDKVLIGANLNERGKLHLWDGFSADYENKIDLPERISAMFAYSSGWVVVAGRTLYITDGSFIRVLEPFPDIDVNDEFATTINGIFVKDDSVFISGGSASDLGNKTTDTQRNKTGLWQYLIDQNKWAYYAYTQDTGSSLQGGTPGVVFYDSNRNTLILGYSTTTIANGAFVATLEPTSTQKSFLLFTHDFDREVDIKRVILNIDMNHSGGSVATPTMTIRSAFSAIDDIIWTYLNHDGTAASAADLVEVGGSASLRAANNKAVFFLEGQNGLELDFISSIANHQETTEQWTLDNDQSGATEADVTLNLLPFYKSEERSLSFSVDTTNNNVAGFSVPVFNNIPAEAEHVRSFGCLFWFNPSNFPFIVRGVHIDYEETQGNA